MGMYVVIKSFQSVPRGNRMNALHKNVAELCSLTSDPEYYCVPVDTIFDTAFVLPNFTEIKTDKHSMIYVYPRDEWKYILTFNTYHVINIYPNLMYTYKNMFSISIFMWQIITFPCLSSNHLLEDVEDNHFSLP